MKITELVGRLTYDRHSLNAYFMFSALYMPFFKNPEII